MRAQTAARFVDEKSTRAFLRRVGTVYPSGVKVPGRGEMGVRPDLEACIPQKRGEAPVEDLANVL
jgi:hypothetical protein